MKSPNRRDYEDLLDYDAAVLRYEDWSDSRRDMEREEKSEPEPVAVADPKEEAWEHAWENWCAENWRTEN
jgi:hypothetical protein